MRETYNYEIRNGLGQVCRTYTGGERMAGMADQPQPMQPSVCLLDHDCDRPPFWYWLFHRLPDPVWLWWLARHVDSRP